MTLFGIKCRIIPNNTFILFGCFNYECIPRAFWQGTGSNDIIREVLRNATMETYEKLESLMQGEFFVTHIDTGVIYPQIQNKLEVFLLQTISFHDA